MASFYLRVHPFPRHSLLRYMLCKRVTIDAPSCFAGFIPEDLAALTKLEQLVLYSNRLSGEEYVIETSMVAVDATTPHPFYAWVG